MTEPVRLDRFVYLLMAVVLIVLLFNLHLWVITTGTEGAIADISREMLARQNFMHPRLLGVDDFSYLPVPLWLTSLGMGLWGVNPFGARFFIQISLVLQVVLIYRIGMRLFGVPQIGLFAGLVYLSCPLVLACSRYLSSDIFVATFELATVYCILFYHLDKRPAALYGIATMLALGALCGGLSSLLLPLTVGIYVLAFGPRNYWVHRRHGIGAIALGISLIAIWFIHANAHLSDFWVYTRQIFWRDAILGPSRHPRWQYLVATVLGSLPWWLVIIPNVAGPVWQNPTVVRVAVFWLGLPLLFYFVTGSTSLAGLLPILAGLVILVSYLIHILPQQQIWQYSRWFTQVYGILGGLALIVPLGYQGQPLTASWSMAITALATLALVALLNRFILAEIRFRLVAMALVPSLMLLIYSGYYVQANGPWKESTDLVSQVIQRRRLEQLPVLVYNEPLPSLAFDLNKDTITINDGLIARTDIAALQDIENRWIHLSNPSANRYLRRLMTDPSVLIVPGDLPARWNWVKINYPKMEWAGRWLVLYRPQ